MGFLKDHFFFPHFIQADTMDCGPTSLRIILKYFGKDISLTKLREMSYTTREGSSMRNLCRAAEDLGLASLGAKISFDQLKNEVPLPCIAHWEQEHYIVVYKVTDKKVFVSDPAIGLATYTHEHFLQNWIGSNANKEVREGIVQLFETTDEFFNAEKEEKPSKASIRFLLPYFVPYKKYIVQLLIGLFAGSILSLIFPFLTQSVVDIGVRNQDIHFVYLILAAQLSMFLGQAVINIVRGWLVLHMSARINISLLVDFFIKLMKLPISYYDVKMMGDIFQRIKDHERIEHLLTTSSLNVLFSILNLVIFGAILFLYDVKVFLVFLFGSILHVAWITIFLKKRAVIDYAYNRLQAKSSEKVFEIIRGMGEIKLLNAERQKRWQWQYLQARLFRANLKKLTLDQTQSTVAEVINEIKNILIAFLTASLVIHGEITLGMMLAASYIIGQLNGPVADLVTFIHDLQDAKLSLERLAEIHDRENEETETKVLINELQQEDTISLKKVSFQYGGPSDNWVLKNLDLDIPKNKITAIVGSSGSGKSTLLKLLLKFYQPGRGAVFLGQHNLNDIAQHYWRSITGVVLQDGFIFSETIENNIALGEETIDRNRLIAACETANIRTFIESLPMAFNTLIGDKGIGISGGEKQRILIARAVYKNPKYLFFDEATSALDAKNERIIMDNLNRWFKGKTVVIIAHRLSTVRNADQIVVLEQGRVLEIGNHASLVEEKGRYFNLVQNQLELERLDD